MASLRVAFLMMGACVCLAPAPAYAQGADPGAAPPPPPPAGGAAATSAVPPPPAQAPQKGEPDPRTRPAPNSVFAEGLGAGLYYSINYERRVIDDLGVRAGFGYVSFGEKATVGSTTVDNTASYFFFPITASYLGVRGGKHALELGGGATLLYASLNGTGQSGGLGFSASASGVTGFGTLMVGYRLHPVGGAGFQFRVGAMGVIGKGLNLFADTYDPNAIGILPYFYLSMGAGF